MNEKFKNTKHGGWVKVYETDYDAEGNMAYIVAYGRDGFPAHLTESYGTEKEALKAYKQAR